MAKSHYHRRRFHSSVYPGPVDGEDGIKFLEDQLQEGKTHPKLRQGALKRLERLLSTEAFDPNQCIGVPYTVIHDREYLDYVPREIRRLWTTLPLDVAIHNGRKDLFEALVSKGVKASAFDLCADVPSSRVEPWSWCSYDVHNNRLARHESFKSHGFKTFRLELANLASDGHAIVRDLIGMYEAEVSYMLSGLADGTAWGSHSLTTALHEAIASSDCESVQNVLLLGANPTSIGPSCYSGIALTVIAKNIEILRMFLDGSKNSAEGNTHELLGSALYMDQADALAFALKVNWMEGFKLLLEHTRSMKDYSYKSVLPFLSETLKASSNSDAELTRLAKMCVHDENLKGLESLPKTPKDIVKRLRTMTPGPEMDDVKRGVLPPYLSADSIEHRTIVCQILLSVVNDGHFSWLQQDKFTKLFELWKLWSPDFSLPLYEGVRCIGRNDEVHFEPKIHVFVALFLTGWWSLETAKIMMRYGASPRLVDGSGFTPLQWAENKQFPRIEAFKSDLLKLEFESGHPS